MKYQLTSILACAALIAASANAATISFEDVSLRGDWNYEGVDYSVYGGEDYYTWKPSSSGKVSSWQKMPESVGRFEWNFGKITSGLHFKTTSYNYNYYNAGGFLLSNSTNKSDTTYANDLCSITGSGAGGSAQYGIFYGSVADSNGVAQKQTYKDREYYSTLAGEYQLTFDDVYNVKSIDITNTAVNGKIFGSPDSASNMGYTTDDNGKITYNSVFNTEDAFIAVLVRGIDTNGELTPLDDAATFVLASYGYLCADWGTLDLSNLATDGLIGLDFQIISSFGNTYGMTSPAYFAFDNILLNVPEPATYAMFFGVIALAFAVRRRALRK